eukprot:575966-Prymnesium_polylepis.1
MRIRITTGSQVAQHPRLGASRPGLLGNHHNTHIRRPSEREPRTSHRGSVAHVKCVQAGGAHPYTFP